jgi:uncharacterized protein (DUF1330 family)
MAKAYWISFYRKINDPNKMAAYARLAGPAITAGGGEFLARAVAEHAFENGRKEHVTLISFESMEAAIATHDSHAYQKALEALAGGAEREIRFVRSLE